MVTACCGVTVLPLVAIASSISTVHVLCTACSTCRSRHAISASFSVFCGLDDSPSAKSQNRKW